MCVDMQAGKQTTKIGRNYNMFVVSTHEQQQQQKKY